MTKLKTECDEYIVVDLSAGQRFLCYQEIYTVIKDVRIYIRELENDMVFLTVRDNDGDGFDSIASNPTTSILRLVSKGYIKKDGLSNDFIHILR